MGKITSITDYSALCRKRWKISDNITPFTDITICGKYEAQKLCENEPNKWCAISICTDSWDAQNVYRFELNNTKKIAKFYFHDIDKTYHNLVICKETDIKSFLSFAKECYGEALLVHCAGGISRSTATAFLIILDSIKDKVKNPAETSIDMIYQLRPIAVPNRYVLELGIPIVARSKEEMIAWFRELYNSRTWKRITGG